jgi:hypothetical protein
MKTKTLWWIVVSVLVAAGAVWWLCRAQTITLDDGTKLKLVAVTYGKHHVFPGKKTADSRPRGRAELDSTNDTLVIWIQSEHKTKQWPNFQLIVYDPANTACVSSWARINTQIKNGVGIEGFMLNAFPRRERKIDLRIGAWNNNGGGMKLARGRFVISNPARGWFPKWTPEPLPNTQSDGDLDVTLTRLVYGVQGFYGSRNEIKNDPMNKAVLTAFRTEQKGVVVTNWQPFRIETSDATGNQVMNNSWSNTREGDEAVMTYQWGLWPDESAWKLRVEMSRTSGFSDDELWTVENIPVNPGRQQDLWSYNNRRSNTNSAFAETTLNGIHLKLFPALQFTDENYGNGQKQGGLRVQIDPEPEGMQMRMTLAKVTDEQGRDLRSWGPNGGNGNYVFQLQDIRNAQSLNITLALHKSRFVEFTAKPTKP